MASSSAATDDTPVIPPADQTIEGTAEQNAIYHSCCKFPNETENLRKLSLQKLMNLKLYVNAPNILFESKKL